MLKWTIGVGVCAWRIKHGLHAAVQFKRNVGNELFASDVSDAIWREQFIINHHISLQSLYIPFHISTKSKKSKNWKFNDFYKICRRFFQINFFIVVFFVLLSTIYIFLNYFFQNVYPLCCFFYQNHRRLECQQENVFIDICFENIDMHVHRVAQWYDISQSCSTKELVWITTLSKWKTSSII